MGNPSNDQVNPWQPMSRPIDLKHIGKLLEELGEAVSAATSHRHCSTWRTCPRTGKSSREWLEDELADVRANVSLCTSHFDLKELPDYGATSDDALIELTIRLGEAIAAASRCLIQGIDGSEPGTNYPNKMWLEEELAAVLTLIEQSVHELELDEAGIQKRAERKKENLRLWHKASD